MCKKNLHKSLVNFNHSPYFSVTLTLPVARSSTTSIRSYTYIGIRTTVIIDIQSIYILYIYNRSYTRILHSKREYGPGGSVNLGVTLDRTLTFKARA